MSCPACFAGGVHDGTPTGTVTKMHGLDVYVAEPASGNPPKGIIGNAASVSQINSMQKVMAPKSWYETLSKPYHILSLLTGALPAVFLNRPGKTWPIVKSFMESLRQNEAAHLPVAVTGYCWGGKHVVLLAEGHKVDGKPLIDVGFTAHPSFLSLFGDIEKLTVPVSFALGEKDNMISGEQAKQLEKIILAKPEGQKGESRIYPGYGHGFACRVDVTNEDPTGAAEAEDQALAWIEKHFEGVKY